MHRLLISLVVAVGFLASASPAYAQLTIVNTEGTPGQFIYRAGLRYAPHYNEGFAVGSGGVTLFATNPQPLFRPYYANPNDPFGPYGYGSVPVGVWRPRIEP